LRFGEQHKLWWNHTQCAAVAVLQVPAYLKRNQQTIAMEKQQLEEYIKLREQPVSLI
jgi:hypothetical protein